MSHASNDVPEAEYNGKATWKNAQGVAAKFFAWLHDPQGAKYSFSVDLTSIEREKVHELFVVYADMSVQSFQGQKMSQKKRLESLVMAALRRQKRVKVKRYDDGVVECSFALADGLFAPYRDRVTARDKLRQQREDLQANKGGIVVEAAPIVIPDEAVLPVDSEVDISFPIWITGCDSPVELFDVIITGAKKNLFQVVTDLPLTVEGLVLLRLSLRTTVTSVYRADIVMKFRSKHDAGIAEGTQELETFSILRPFSMSAARDQAMMQMLQPVTPYQKRRIVERRFKKNDVVHPPKPIYGSRATTVKYRRLKEYKIPIDVRETAAVKVEAEIALEPPTQDTPEEDLPQIYQTFWQQLLWMSELQTYEDIKLFDMENASLESHGRLLKLEVPGLAEGRPSVLRGDIVLCNWKGKQYRGRVESVQLLHVLLEFHQSFHRSFNVSLDRVDLVRFTFSRTTFRTSHQGCLLAPSVLRSAMLMPNSVHIRRILHNSNQHTTRILPETFLWASRSLNDEQKVAVEHIARATLRPMPYIIYGPPGTGKTTTMSEAIYQLARLNVYNQKQNKLKILVVAPSNDATDLLVEKLSVYFPPSEMLRVLAFTRNISDVPPAVRPYCREELDWMDLKNALSSFQIIASTVNLAARFSNVGNGIPEGFFDVVCIDEAGHATEPEVMGVVASLMKFDGKNAGQLIFAGDPNQLGPVITSAVCQKFGMGMSYMERLVKTSPAYLSGNGESDMDSSYSPDLVTMLVRNYRSHPAILKLPNEMFYNNKLLACGDRLTTHSMARWEHLPSTANDFPIIFHSIDGRNLREGTSPSWFNPEEVVEVVEYVNKLINQSRPRVAPEDIGVITPYARQVQKINIALRAKNFIGVKVGSVETFQGQERRCIIVSTVRSQQHLLSHDQKYNLGFVANEKRFNVAVTRAKALLIVVGNPDVLATDKKNWLPFLRFCKDNGGWIGEEWSEELAENEATSEGVSQAIDDEDDEQEEWEMVPDDIPRGFINREE
ncbi:DNA/RNA helicase, superfamily II, SNF2 family protein [Nitzschia inconspicua]|uniref:RNA helicase n=1 Tax=Nitzschia inconspicua TaxID=303405 RepID=A0A9K3PT82_9STRA|nr:DNA/RNA helicase, superfamily II, SNF2 family protein [Nitzschia inconspicua]